MSSCLHCSLTICTQCITNNKYCHNIDNSRTICNIHNKIKNIYIDINRCIISKNQNIIYNKTYIENNKIFNNNVRLLYNNFYNEFNGTAHYYDIYDYNDIVLWKGIFITHTII